MKAFKPVLKFWEGAKKRDDKRIAAQPVPDFDDAKLDIDYFGDGDIYHTLNVYRPKGAEGKLPVIFDIHGGGWYYGDKELNSYYCRSLVREGFAVVDISYRLAPDFDVYAQVEDVFKAMEHISARAEEYGLDLDRFFIAGDSAGGHLAGLAINIVKDEALQKVYNVTPSIEIKGACLICPAADPIHLAPVPKSLLKLYFNPVFGKGYLKDERTKYANYYDILRGDICPVFFITCRGDFLRKQTLKAYELTKEKGVRTELFCLEKPYDEAHKLEHVFNVLHWEWQEAYDANKAMCDFFKSL